MSKDNFYDVSKKRFSVRRYSEKPVPSEMLDKILEIGREAASAANKQPWYFIVCINEDKLRLDKVFYREGFRAAPVAIAAVADMKEAWIRKSDGKNFAYVDVSIAVTEMILAATAEGLGTCWIAAYDYPEAKRILEIPENMEIVTLITIGFPESNEKQPERARKEMKDIAFKGKFGKPWDK
jgi:nitroreductase